MPANPSVHHWSSVERFAFEFAQAFDSFQMCKSVVSVLPKKVAFNKGL